MRTIFYFIYYVFLDELLIAVLLVFTGAQIDGDDGRKIENCKCKSLMSFSLFIIM